MAVAKCGQMFSWDSPMWCNGKVVNNTTKEKSVFAKMCVTCPWWEGHKREED